ncbi:MAG TPA: DUF4956 domain-containing protein [Gemmatimonadaceae bacterium]|nr:DUF4956 domain-containing protein [Gemmatimonadaceae bacterium]
MAYRAPRLSSPHGENIVLRATAYYLALFVVVVVLWQAWPPFHAAVPRLTDVGRELTGQHGAAVAPAGATGPEVARRGPLAATVFLAMSSAVLLALPVAWVYRLTRSKRGFQQSVVQTLVILPMVVAGVVVLVKDSLALAFGLAGIVAAVRFRTSLDDSKDAMYVFLATGVGLAAAVDLPVAAVLSVVFNAVILLLWYTDFGRQPARLEGRAGERRMRHALSHPSRTGTFVARVDDEVLSGMSAEQLEALADRATRRARMHDPDGDGAGGERRELTLRLYAPDPAAAHRAVGQVLDQYAKRWREGDVREEPDGAGRLEYFVMLRRRVEPDEMMEGIRAATGLGANEVELR